MGHALLIDLIEFADFSHPFQAPFIKRGIASAQVDKIAPDMYPAEGQNDRGVQAGQHFVSAVPITHHNFTTLQCRKNDVCYMLSSSTRKQQGFGA